MYEFLESTLDYEYALLKADAPLEQPNTQKV